MASHSVRSWNPLAKWLQAVDKLRRAGFVTVKAKSVEEEQEG